LLSYRRRQPAPPAKLASFRGIESLGPIRHLGQIRPDCANHLSSSAEENRYFSDFDQKSGCQRTIDSLSRAGGGRANHPPRISLSRSEPITPEELAKTAATLASDKKAEDIVVLDLREISTFTDFFVICSGTSEPHLKAIAGEIETRLREDHKTRPAAVDGFPASQWIVLDYMQVIVHVFHREKRDFYSLEDLWSDAPRVEIPGLE